ncbi:MAG: hypothetical protein J6V95_02895 [Bacteroidaceae bacterium]|nr:hypothetical protein [Bacteroidaceae bacterium]
MNKNFKWVMAAIIVCGASLFTSCDDKDKELSATEQLTQKMLGKWMPVESNGVEVLTDQKTVTTFKLTASGLKAYTSVSSFVMPSQTQSNSQDASKPDEWKHEQEADVKIENGKFIVTRPINDTINQISRYYILEAKGSTIEIYISTRLSINGQEVMGAMGHTEVWSKVNVGYSKDIVGLWEGHVTSDTSRFDDGETHRWRYNADGTYVYYSQDQEGNWKEVESVFNNYFVDGYLLCTRWKNVGEDEYENREWWEIESIDNDSMKWTAQRVEYEYVSGPNLGVVVAIPNKYTATFSMTRVDERK